MNLAALPNWAFGLLMALLFVVAPATSHLLGPSETDAALEVAADLAQAPADERIAMQGPQ